MISMIFLWKAFDKIIIIIELRAFEITTYVTAIIAFGETLRGFFS